MGYKTKIDWCDSSWNPVTGCLHECEYCYARGIANLFGGTTPPVNGWDHYRVYHPFDGAKRLYELDYPLLLQKDGTNRKAPYPFSFAPTLHRYRLDQPSKWSEPRTIFVCSMADLFGEWVPEEWIEEVFKACEAAPQHRYLFLTKNPNRLNQLARDGKLPQQHWYGYTATNEGMLWSFTHAIDCHIKNLFVSIEPILEPMQPCFSTHTPADWVIIGAETGNRKDKVTPERDWIMNIARECSYSGRPIFMKDSLRELMGDDFKQEFPWEADGHEH